MESNHVPFRVRPHTPEEYIEYDQILEARADVNLRKIYDGASARAFLEKYPNSIYRSLAYGLLSRGRFCEKDWRGQSEWMHFTRETLGSDTFTDASYYAEAMGFVRAGDPAAAVKLLRETNLANSRALREDLEARYGPFVDPEPVPPKPPAPVPAPPQNTTWIWLVSGIAVGIALLILLRSYRQSHPQR